MVRGVGRKAAARACSSCFIFIETRSVLLLKENPAKVDVPLCASRILLSARFPIRDSITKTQAGKLSVITVDACLERFWLMRRICRLETKTFQSGAIAYLVDKADQ